MTASASARLGEDARLALEATCGWEWLAELLEGERRELHLAHPLRTKALASARVKTDTVDAIVVSAARAVPGMHAVAVREIR